MMTENLSDMPLHEAIRENLRGLIAEGTTLSTWPTPP